MKQNKRCWFWQFHDYDLEIGKPAYRKRGKTNRIKVIYDQISRWVDKKPTDKDYIKVVRVNRRGLIMEVYNLEQFNRVYKIWSI